MNNPEQTQKLETGLQFGSKLEEKTYKVLMNYFPSENQIVCQSTIYLSLSKGLIHEKAFTPYCIDFSIYRESAGNLFIECKGSRWITKQWEHKFKGLIELCATDKREHPIDWLLVFNHMNDYERAFDKSSFIQQTVHNFPNKVATLNTLPLLLPALQ